MPWPARQLSDRLGRWSGWFGHGASHARQSLFLHAGRQRRISRWYPCDGALGADRVLVDPNRLDETGGASVTWLSPTEDGKLLACRTVRRRQATTARLLDVGSHSRSLQIQACFMRCSGVPTAQGSSTGLRDATDRSAVRVRSIVWIRRPRPTSAVSPGRGEGQPQLAQSAGRPARSGTDAGSCSRIGSIPSNDLWLARFDEFLAGAVASGRERQGCQAGRGDGDRRHAVSSPTKGAARGRVISATRRGPPALWRGSFRNDRTRSSIRCLHRAAIPSPTCRTSAFLEAFDFQPRPPEDQSARHQDRPITASDDRTEAYRPSGFNYPPTVFRVDLANPSAPPKYWTSPDAPIDPSLAQVEQVSYPSKDGTKITMFLFHKKGFVPNGTAPTVLTGYGAFGVPMLPMFWGPFFRWVEAGGVIAMPNVRGGGEYGEAWHQAGMRDRKQTGIDDLIAAADWLVAGRYTRERLAVRRPAAGSWPPQPPCSVGSLPRGDSRAAAPT